MPILGGLAVHAAGHVLLAFFSPPMSTVNTDTRHIFPGCLLALSRVCTGTNLSIGHGFDVYAAAVACAMYKKTERRVRVLVVFEPDSGQVWLYPALPRRWKVEQEVAPGESLT
jgi:hypothetical protein